MRLLDAPMFMFFAGKGAGDAPKVLQRFAQRP